MSRFNARRGVGAQHRVPQADAYVDRAIAVGIDRGDVAYGDRAASLGAEKDGLLARLCGRHVREIDGRVLGPDPQNPCWASTDEHVPGSDGGHAVSSADRKDADPHAGADRKRAIICVGRSAYASNLYELGSDPLERGCDPTQGAVFWWR